MTLQYNTPNSGTPSAIDGDGTKSSQMHDFYYLKKAIITARKDQYFTPLGSTENLPKHMGKAIKVYEYLPLLDDRNVNDQGIDAAGALTAAGTFKYTFPKLLIADEVLNADATTLKNAIEAADTTVAATLANADGTNSATHKKVTLDKLTLTPSSTALQATLDTQLALAGITGFKKELVVGNLYGSSKDIGTINGKLPILGENGGRKNRVGFTRITHTGSIQKYGFFYEFTQESMDFDSDAQMKDHLARELMNGAVQVYEATLQKDLLNNATTIIFPGTATQTSELSGDADDGLTPAFTPTVVTFADLQRLDQALTDNRTPKQTTVKTGSRNIDTRTIPAARIMYVGSEVMPIIRAMTDQFGNPAFIPVQHYAGQGGTLNGEVGALSAFRVIEVPEMLHWTGVGAKEESATGATGNLSNGGYRVGPNAAGTANHYNVYPMLVVGDDSFASIGFEGNNGKTGKFSVITKMPGVQTADVREPYGEIGFSSIKWYYGVLVKRSERLGLIKTVAPV